MSSRKISIAKREERVQKEVSQILKKTFDHPDVVEFTKILLEEFPDIQNNTELDLALYIKNLDDERFDRYLNDLLTKPKSASFTKRSIKHLASGKKSKKKKKTRKAIKPIRRKTKAKGKFQALRGREITGKYKIKPRKSTSNFEKYQISRWKEEANSEYERDIDLYMRKEKRRLEEIKNLEELEKKFNCIAMGKPKRRKTRRRRGRNIN